MKKVFFILFFAIVYNTIIAQQISLKTAEDVALTYLHALNNKNVNIVNIHSYSERGHTYLYEVVADDNTHIILTGNKKCKPIIASFYTSNAEPIFANVNNIPAGLQLLIDDYINQMSDVFLNDTISSKQDEYNEWDSLSAGIYRDAPGFGPLIESQWGQSISNDNVDTNAYNHHVPHGNNCDHCVAGCVAVAMGQIMYYWKHPVICNRAIPQFDWCNMVETLITTASNYSKKREAIAHLLYMCGDATGMVYGCYSSGTSPSTITPALERFGYYSSGVTHRPSNDVTWNSLLKTSIQNKHPVIYNAFNSNGDGHTFICDGFRNVGEFHFNWGWNNNYDGFYYINALVSNSAYLYDHSAILLIKPLENQPLCNYSLLLDTFYHSVYTIYPNYNRPAYEITPMTMTTLISASATSSAGYRTIPSGATAEYVAHKEIILQPGFKAERGCDFTARIEPCELCEQQMVTLSFAGNETSQELFDATAIESQTIMIGDTAFAIKPSRLSLFPNPAENILTIVSPDEIKDVNIFDQMGKQVFRWFVTKRSDDSISINVADISHGTYIVRIITCDGNIHIGRFVKK